MKITEQQLKQLVQEEVSLLTENRAKLSEAEKKKMSDRLGTAQEYLTYVVQDINAGLVGPREYDVLKGLITLAGSIKNDISEILRNAGIPTSDSMKKWKPQGTFE